jgi:hypothetical protein
MLNSAPTETSPKNLQKILWDHLHERLKTSFEQRLLDHIDQTIQQFYPGYCSNDGRVIDRRLAQRIGVNPAMLSRLRAGDGSAMTKLAHFLALMNLCGIHWYEGGFLPPQKVVLDALTHLFPTAQRLLGIHAAPPNGEQILVLYFASRIQLESCSHKLQTPDSDDVRRNQCDRVIDMVASAECDGPDESAPLIENPRETCPSRIMQIVETHSPVWNLLLDTFPFLGKPNRKGESWGMF